MSILVLHSDAKNTPSGPLLFLRYLWFLLSDINNFYTVTIRNDQRTYLE